MSMGTLGMVAESVRGVLHGADREFDAVSTDTRSLGAGELFVALRGPNFDAADFISEAERLGAAGALVERRSEIALSQVEVSDTRLALGDLARNWRRRFDIPVIGITGSNGKTTVKNLCASIMHVALASEDVVLATRGNFNNDIGLPLMVLELRDTHQAAVLEMGASAAGEIAYLAGVAEPRVGVLTNAGPAHLEGFGSIAGVAAAKGELFAALPADGVAVINRDDEYFAQWRQRAAHTEQRSFGLHSRADYRAEAISQSDSGGLRFRLCTPDDSFDVSLALSGGHNVRNALAAAAACMASGADAAAVRAGLAGASHASGRLLPVTTASGTELFDDSYNANPASVLAAIEFLATRSGERWLVLGDMAELGADSESLHGESGAAAKAGGIDRLLTVGRHARAAAAAFGDGAVAYDSREELAAAVRDELRPGLSILVKGSRSMGMEQLVAALAAVGGEN